MDTRSANNPYGNTQMVDRLIGTAYDIVKTVYENLQYIKHVSANLPQIQDVYEDLAKINAVEAELVRIGKVADEIAKVATVADNIVQVDLVAAQMTALLAVYNDLASVITTAQNITAVNTVANSIVAVGVVATNMDDINTLVENLPAIENVVANIPTILTAVADAEAARDLAQQYAQDAFENAHDISWASDTDAIDNTNITKVMNPHTTYVAFEHWKDSISTLIMQPKSFTGVAGTNVTYALDSDPGAAKNVFVYVGGVRQIPLAHYTVSGSTLTIMDNPDGLDVDTLIFGTTAVLNTLGGKTEEDFLQPPDVRVVVASQHDIGYRTELYYNAASDNATDDSAHINELITWVNGDPLRRKAAIMGRVYCASDIPNIHAIQIEGPGSLRIGTGPEFFVEPNKINRGFSALNTLYVDPANGNNANSGLAPEFAFKTTQRAMDVLALKGTPIQGYWQIMLLEGVYTESQVSSFSVQSMRGQPIYVKGPTVDAWSIAAKPPVPTPISAITATNPPVVTSNAHGLSNGDKVFIGLAAKSGGAHESDGKIYTITNVTTNMFELSGVDGSAWSAYTGNGIAYGLKGSRPKAVFYGSGNGSGWALQFDGNATFTISDIMGVNYGTKAGAGDEGLLIGRTFSNIRTTNIHAYNCSKGQESRDKSVCIFSSGWSKDCYVGLKGLDARITFGTSNPSTIRDDCHLVQTCTIGVDLWEMTSGHVDGNTIIDCPTEIWVRKNSHAVVDHNQFTNNGSAKNGPIVSDGGYMNATNNAWTGNYRSTIVRKNGGHLEIDANTRTPAVEVLTTIPAVTAGGGETTLMSSTIPQGMLQAAGDGFRMKMLAVGTWSSNTVVVNVKLGSNVICSWTLPANAAAREIRLDAAIRVNGFLQIAADTLFIDKQSNTTQTPVFDIITGVAFDTSSGDQTLSVTAQITAASGDTFIGRVIELERSGW